MTLEACPCTSGKSYAECCQPYHQGKAQPPTAEALMRARYSAFAKGEIDYIKNTLDSKGQKTFDRKAITDWSRGATWQKLEIHETEKGQPGDTEGIVEFTAHFEMDGKPVAHRERSVFRVHDGKWKFVDTIDAIKKPVIREAVPGRNDPCHCGSGKKYKKCHGLAA